MMRWTPPVLFLSVFAVYYASPVSIVVDSRWTLPTARSLLRERNTDLDEYADPGFDSDFRIERVRNRHRAIYPVGTAVLAVPFVAAMETIGGRNVLADLPRSERFIASVIVALAVVFLWFAVASSEGVGGAIASALLFAFATSAWSTASRALWQLGPSMLCLSIALWILVSARKDPARVRFAALPLAFAFVVRPTGAIPAVVLTLYVLAEHRKWFWRFVLWGLPVPLALLAYNLAVYEALLPPYYLRPATYVPGWVAPQSMSSILGGFAGTLIAPSRGLFVYSPFLLLAAWGSMILRRRRDPLVPYLAAIFILYWISISTWKMWWGGHSYGPRMMSEVVPFLIWLSAPVLGLAGKWAGLRRRLLIGGLVALSLFSGVVHARGAFSVAVWQWNHIPVSVDIATRRLWDMRDAQFLR